MVLLCGTDFFGKDEQYTTEGSIFFIAAIFRSYS